MTITFEKSGGFTGIAMRCVVNSEQLSDLERSELEGMLKAAEFFDLPTQISAPSGAADVFHFRITVQEEQRVHTVDVDQTVIPRPLTPLIKWLQSRRGK